MYRVTYVLVTWGWLGALAASVALPDPAHLYALALMGALTLACVCAGDVVASRIRSGVCSGSGRKVVIGGGQQAMLQKRALVGVPIRVPRGRQEDREWWHAGTAISEVQHTLACEGLTLPSHPSATSATLGAWAFTNSHGTGGTLWTPSLGQLRVNEQDESGCVIREFVVSSKNVLFGDGVDEAYARRYIVTGVQVKAIPERVVRRRAFDLTGVDDCESFLRTPTHLRAIFVTKAVSTAFVWEPTSSGTAAGGNVLVEWFVPPWFATILPGRLFAAVPRDRWTRCMSLRAANRFGPSFEENFPLLTTFAYSFSFLYENFELFIVCPVTAELLWRVCRTIQEAFAGGELKGRCELRCGSKKLFVDFAIVGGGSSRAMEVVADAIGEGYVVSLHRGKCDVDTAPLMRIGT